MLTADVALGDYVTPRYLSVEVIPPRLKVVAIQKRRRWVSDTRMTTMVKVHHIDGDGNVIPVGRMLIDDVRRSKTDDWFQPGDLDPYDVVAEKHRKWAEARSQFDDAAFSLGKNLEAIGVDGAATISPWNLHERPSGLRLTLRFDQALALAEALRAARINEGTHHDD